MFKARKAQIIASLVWVFVMFGGVIPAIEPALAADTGAISALLSGKSFTVFQCFPPLTQTDCQGIGSELRDWNGFEIVQPAHVSPTRQDVQFQSTFGRCHVVENGLSRDEWQQDIFYATIDRNGVVPFGPFAFYSVPSAKGDRPRSIVMISGFRDLISRPLGSEVYRLWEEGDPCSSAYISPFDFGHSLVPDTSTGWSGIVGTHNDFFVLTIAQLCLGCAEVWARVYPIPEDKASARRPPQPATVIILK